jgi:hypothetical protein
VVFGRVVPIPPPPPPSALTKEAGALYESAAIQQVGRLLVTVPMEGRFGPEVVAPELVLALYQRGPVTPLPGLRCDTFEDLGADFSGPVLPHGGFRYKAVQGAVVGTLRAATVGGQPALRYPDQGVDIALPQTATEVTATIFQARIPGDDVQPAVTLTLRCISPSGQIVATTVDHRDIIDQNRTMRAQDPSGLGISRVILTGGRGAAHLVRLCYRAPLDPRVESLLEEASQSGGVPRVTGTRTDGLQATWVPTIIFGPAVPQSSCTLVLYRPREQGEWTRVRIGPWAASRVGILHGCAITAEALDQWEEAEEARQDFIEEWNETTPSRFLLEPDTEYVVRVRWEAAAWARPEDEKGAPSQSETFPPTDPDFTESDTESFFFRTAAAVSPLPAEAPIDTERETIFDPRQARRYVARMLPDHLSPPHFTGDPAHVAYQVGYLETLMQRYGRELVVSVRRTDPAPGSQPPGSPPPPPAPPTSINPIDFPLDLLDMADLRVIEVTGGDSCLEPYEPEGSAGELFFDLDPDAEYDLLLTAPVAGQEVAEEEVIQRTQFRTSHFASPRELLDAFGLTEPSPSPILPVEVLVDSALPGDEVLGDAPFDEAMATLGLDPFPLASGPRIALLLRQAPELELVGVLLEAPEPIHREGRLRIEQMEIRMDDGTVVPLTTVRRNAAGTRILLAPEDPATFDEGTALMSCVLSGSREGSVSGTCYATVGGLRLAETLSP